MTSLVPFVILRLAFSGETADLGSLGWSAGEPQRAERNPRKPCIPTLRHPFCIGDRERDFTSAWHAFEVVTAHNSVGYTPEHSSELRGQNWLARILSLPIVPGSCASPALMQQLRVPSPAQAATIELVGDVVQWSHLRWASRPVHLRPAAARR